MVLPVLYRDAAVAIVDKPAGLAVEADGPESVVRRLATELAPLGGRAWPRVVHRLDTDTSGCLAVALNDAAANALASAFEAGSVEKEYLAIVAGAPDDEGKLDTAYGKDPRDGRRWTTRLKTPRRARLSWRVEERLLGAALVRIVLDTGRTHQIRVQLSEAGFPLLGDAVYGVPAPPACGLKRQALHAFRLAFPLPTGQRVDVRAPLPDDLAAALRALRS